MDGMDTQAMKQHRYQGILLLLISTVLLACMDGISKLLSASFSVPLLVWMRYVVHLVLMLVFIAPGMGREIIVTRRPWLMILRGLMQAGSSLLAVLAFSVLPLAEATALAFTSPLLVALFAGPLLGEKVTLRHWLAIFAGFGGVLLVVRPGSALFGIGVFYALGCALCSAGYQLLTRKLATTESPIRQLFFMALVSALVLTPGVPVYWDATLPSPQQALLILSLGIFGAAGHFLLIRAFRETPASILSPLLYIQLLWVTVFGWLVFEQFPDLPAFLGMLVIGGASLFIALGQQQTKQG